MKQVTSEYIMEKWFNDVVDEDITVDPISLTNMILDKNLRQGGFDWSAGSRQDVSIKDIFKVAPSLSFMVGDFIREQLEEAEQKSKEETPPPETNSRDPRIFSTNPEFNACPAFLNGVCRVNGRPCNWSNFAPSGEPTMDYNKCSIYPLASGGDPALFTIELGAEANQYYALGKKA
jgi:hypothetical protein